MWKIELQVCYSSLGKQQKQAVDYLLQHEELVGTMTIRECANGAGVGQPTVIRMLTACGYKSWSDFQHEVWKEMAQSKETATSETEGDFRGRGQGRRENSVLQIIRERKIYHTSYDCRIGENFRW